MYKWVMAWVLGAACLLGVGVLFSQINNNQSEVPQAAVAPAIPEVAMNPQAAEAIYKQSCIACHGTDLEGKMGPNLQKVGATLSDEQLFKLVQNGRGAMPAFKSTLKEEEINNIAKWLAEKK
ncbi:c-type cytochrome [Paenibacillus agricola]|uniref:Cytochrome c n=1 Tax=Paenibacillus agricola TaxID=2716264 RepID=A0ABX0J3R9_9BACL|nr:cytochrome c [Paenibacillus agricola]NHN30471.1 cytochrome c [Paenibacillus agricola]